MNELASTLSVLSLSVAVLFITMAASGDVEPLFMKNSDLSLPDLKPYDICEALSRVVGVGNVDGAQKVGNIWRLYLKNNKSRADIYLKKELVVNGRKVKIFDGNPQYVTSQIHVNDKLTIKDCGWQMMRYERCWKRLV